MDTRNLAEQLDQAFYARINAHDNNIINATYIDDDESKEVADFIEQKRTVLKTQLNIVFDKMKAQKESLIKAMQDEISKADLTSKPARLKLEASEEDKINAFEDDENTTVLLQQLRRDIATTRDQIDEFRENHMQRKSKNTVTTPTARAAAPQPAAISTLTFWQRHPVAKSVLIGMAFGLAIVSTAAIVLGAMILSGGAAAAPIMAFAQLLAAKLGLTGAIAVTAAAGVATVGVTTGIGAAAGASQKRYQEAHPESLQQPSFWQRHAVAKNFLIGMAIGFALISAAAITLGAIVLSGGAAAAPIIAFAGLLAAKLTVAGAIGVTAAAAAVVVGSSAAIGAAVGHKQAQHQAVNVASSTAIMHKELRLAPEAHQCKAKTESKPAPVLTEVKTKSTMPTPSAPQDIYSPRLNRK